jgi:hypothetical protein
MTFKQYCQIRNDVIKAIKRTGKVHLLPEVPKWGDVDLKKLRKVQGHL